MQGNLASYLSGPRSRHEFALIFKFGYQISIATWCHVRGVNMCILFPELQRDLFMLLTFKEKFTVGQLFLEVR
jgi:hypothetical protein